ncbi:hypothetical protein Tco_0426567, partial [Tanacetum coccineum]
GDVMVVRGDDDVVFGGWVAEEPIFLKRTLRCLQEANRTEFCDEVEVEDDESDGVMAAAVEWWW